ncbi:hypothetical protein AAMO2058_000045100 [Amorphochlora amoebiformis]
MTIMVVQTIKSGNRISRSDGSMMELLQDFKDMGSRLETWRKASHQTTFLGFAAILIFFAGHRYLLSIEECGYLLACFFLMTWISMVSSLLYHWVVTPIMQMWHIEASAYTIREIDMWGQVANLHYLTHLHSLPQGLQQIRQFKGWDEKSMKMVNFGPERHGGSCVFAAHHKNEKKVIICYRGTRTIEDIQVDLDAGFCKPLYLQHYTEYLHNKYKDSNLRRLDGTYSEILDYKRASEVFGILPNLEKMRLHTGFNRRYELVRSEVLDFLNKAVEEGAREVVFTGHSLGGACATLSAMDFLLTLSIRSSFTQDKSGDNIKTKLISFGSPRCGNEAMADVMSTLLPGGKHKRVRNDQDIVCSLPHPAVGFLHRNHRFLVFLGLQYIFRNLLKQTLLHLGQLSGQNETGQFFSFLYERILALQIVFLLSMFFVPYICRLQEAGREGLFRHCGESYILFHNGQVWERPAWWMEELHEFQSPLALLEFGKSLFQHKMKNYIKVLSYARNRSTFFNIGSKDTLVERIMRIVKDSVRMSIFAKRFTLFLVVVFSWSTAFHFVHMLSRELWAVASNDVLGASSQVIVREQGWKD